MPDTTGVDAISEDDFAEDLADIAVQPVSSQKGAAEYAKSPSRLSNVSR